jgi:hypothetical protein
MKNEVTVPFFFEEPVVIGDTFLLSWRILLCVMPPWEQFFS